MALLGHRTDVLMWALGATRITPGAMLLDAGRGHVELAARADPRVGVELILVAHLSSAGARRKIACTAQETARAEAKGQAIPAPVHDGR